MSEESIGRSELALGGVLVVVLLGGMFFLYRSLATDPASEAREQRPVVSAEATPARPATPDAGIAPPPINSPPRSGSGQTASPEETPNMPASGAPMRQDIRRPGPENPWFASGAGGNRPRGSGGSEGGGEFL